MSVTSSVRPQVRVPFEGWSGIKDGILKIKDGVDALFADWLKELTGRGGGKTRWKDIEPPVYNYETLY